MDEEQEIKHEVKIEEYYDGFSITVDGENFMFDQVDSMEKLLDVFYALDIPAEYEEVC